MARGADTAVGLRRGGQRILLLLDPGLAGQLLAGRAADTVKGPGVQLTRAMLGNGLLTSEGAQHDQARRLVAPAFSPRRLDHYVTTFGQCAQAHVAGWQDGQQVDAYAEMGTLTLQIVGRSLLGIDLTAQAPRVRARLESALAEFGPPCGKYLPALRYTRAVVSEAIRLYPPAWIIGRTVTADLELGGWHLPAGSVAAVSPLLLHHDPRWFGDPEVFDPGRWLGDRRNAISKGAYLPFGTGPRACIGEQFAWAKAVTVLAVLARSWAVRTDPGFRPAIEYRVTLRPAGGLPVVVRSRH